MTQIILVDDNDNQIGVASKLEVHQLALKHRAFSVFIFTERNHELCVLLQQRNYNKYHCGGLWSNSCCGHPYPDESIIQAGERRLHEEMGLKLTLQSVGVFHYIAHFSNGLTENEIDHVLVGNYTDEQIMPCSNEVSNYKFMPLTELEKSLHDNPNLYTPWLKPAFKLAKNHFN